MDSEKERNPPPQQIVLHIFSYCAIIDASRYLKMMRFVPYNSVPYPVSGSFMPSTRLAHGDPPARVETVQELRSTSTNYWQQKRVELRAKSNSARLWPCRRSTEPKGNAAKLTSQRVPR